MNKYNSILNTFRVFDDFKNKCKNKAELYRDYAFYVLHNRFPDGEPIIAQDPLYAFFYARDVIENRFPLGEPAIAKKSNTAYWYAIEVIKGRFPTGEKTIYNSNYQNDYKEKILQKLGLTWKDLGYE